MLCTDTVTSGRPTEAEMDAFEAAYSFKLPPSDRAFLTVFGDGDASFMFHFSAPGVPARRDLKAMAEKAREDEWEHPPGRMPGPRRDRNRRHGRPWRSTST